MTGSIRRVAFTLLALIGITAGWLTFAATDAGSRYRDDPRNLRSLGFAPGDARGRLLSADGVVLAEDAEGGARSYPEGRLYAHIVGYDSPFGRSGVESTRFADLRSQDDSITSWLLGLGGDFGSPPDMALTIVDAIQRAAYDGLGDRAGAVVALDPRTGAVLAYVSGPADDPNAIAAGDVDPEEREQSLDRVADQVLPPGSTFKVLVSAAALAEGFDPADEFEDAAEYLAPGAGSPIGNAGDGVCGSGGTLTLTEALVVSCNTVFARLAVDLGGNAVAGTAEAAGFNAPIQWETGLVRSSIPPGSDLDADLGALAQTGIGERDVRATPLLMALIAGALGNDGVAMAPYIVDHRATGSGRIYDRTDPRAIARMFAADHAAALLEMMTAVVERGTGTAARMEGIAVAGKTGTAEGSGGPHAWFIAVAPADDPRIAIAVVVEGAGSGGRVAAPIAARVLAAWQGSDL